MHIASNTRGEKPVASTIRSNLPCSAAISGTVVRFELAYVAPSASTRSELRYGASSRPTVTTSSPRMRSASVAIKPTAPAPRTAARRGCQTLKRRWISYACEIPFWTMLMGSSKTATSRKALGMRIRYSGSST